MRSFIQRLYAAIALAWVRGFMKCIRCSRYWLALLLPKPRDRIRDAFDCDDLQAVDFLLRLVGLRDDRAGEAELGGFLQALLAARRGAHLAGESYLAEYRELFRERLVGERGDDREQHRQVCRGLAYAHAAHGVHEHVLVVAGDARMAVQHREQHREAVLLQAHRQPPRVGRVRRVDQRLDLDQERPSAFLRDQNAGAGHLAVVLRKENRRRVGHAAQALVGHRENAQLVHRPEAVLERADQAKALVRVALEIEHRVHDVLDHARAGDRALLGDVADQHDDGAAPLRIAGEMRHAFAHLCDRAGSGSEALRIERLDRVDDSDLWLRLLERREDALQLDFGEALELGTFRDAGEAVLRRAFGDAFDQRVPRAAVRALPLPLRRLAAAFGAGVDGSRLRHQSASTTGTRGESAQSSS